MDKLISIVIPVYNEEKNISLISEQIENYLENHSSYEVIFIDDGSSDSTLDEIERVQNLNGKFKYISFSKNFGHQAALRAGLEVAKGEAVICMDGDLQHPPGLIPEMIKIWESGFELVLTKRIDHWEQNFFKKFSSKIFYKILNSLSDVDIQDGCADFRLISRKALDCLNNFKESDIFYRGIIGYIGFKSKTIDYVPNKRHAGKSKYGLKKMIFLAITGVTSLSTKPLIFSVFLGLFFSMASFLYAIYALYGKLFTNFTIDGWTSVILSVLFIGGIQLVILGVIGQYIGKIFIQVKKRPSYIINKLKL